MEIGACDRSQRAAHPVFSIAGSGEHVNIYGVRMQYEVGQYYHAFNRGNNKNTLFVEDVNYHYLLE